MPSKAAIQVADDFNRRRSFAREGIEGGSGLSVTIPDALEHVRDLRDIFVDRVLSHSTDTLGDAFINHDARFVEPGTLQAGDTTIRYRAAVIATGTRPVIPRAWRTFGDRILSTDELFELESLPGSLAVVGLGMIGVELGQALRRLGIEVTGIDTLQSIAAITDPVVNRVAVELLGKEFPLWLGHPAELSQENGRLRVRAGEHSALVDKVLASLGRVPNIEKLGLDTLGVPIQDNGIPLFDSRTMKLGDLPIYLAGDVTGERQILHEAAEEGRIAGLNATRRAPVAFRRKPLLSIAFSDPNLCAVGRRFDELDPTQTAIGEFRFGPLGRALIMGKNRGVLRVYARKSDGVVLGAAMAAPGGEHLAHLIAWSIDRRLSVIDLLRMPYYHPSIEEALQAALRDLYAKLGSSGKIPPDLTPGDGDGPA